MLMNEHVKLADVLEIVERYVAPRGRKGSVNLMREIESLPRIQGGSLMLKVLNEMTMGGASERLKYEKEREDEKELEAFLDAVRRGNMRQIDEDAIAEAVKQAIRDLCEEEKGDDAWNRRKE